MKRHETRVLVEESEAGVEYYPQYKWHLFWIIPIWEGFDPCFAPKHISRAWTNTYREGFREKTKECAEYMCEIYHKLCDEQEVAERKEKLHKKTRKITSYKHP